MLFKTSKLCIAVTTYTPKTWRSDLHAIVGFSFRYVFTMFVDKYPIRINVLSRGVLSCRKRLWGMWLGFEEATVLLGANCYSSSCVWVTSR